VEKGCLEFKGGFKLGVINLNQYKENKDEVENSYLEFLPIWNNYWKVGPNITGDIISKQLYTALRLADAGIMLMKILGMLDNKGRKVLIDWLEGMIENLRN